jgi:hypothetical protein
MNATYLPPEHVCIDLLNLPTMLSSIGSKPRQSLGIFWLTDRMRGPEAVVSISKSEVGSSKAGQELRLIGKRRHKTKYCVGAGVTLFSSISDSTIFC